MDPRSQEVWRSLHDSGADALLAARHSWIEDRYGLQVILEGSGSFVVDSADPPPALPAADADHVDLLENRDLGSRRWFIVVDSRGRMRWSFKGDDDRRLLVLACRQTPPAYLAYLRREQIPYLVAGEARVDLLEALSLIKNRLGADCVVSEAGGGLNGALLRAGLVDELHLVVLPALVGGADTPTTFDGPALGSTGVPQTMRLADVRHVGDAIWLRYESHRPVSAT